MAKWSFKEDFKKTDWTSTLIYNMQRAVGMGIVALIIAIFSGEPFKLSYIFMPVVAPIIYLVILVPIGLAAAWLADLDVPFVGLITIVCSFYVLVGDPLVWLADLVIPKKIVPVENPKFINFALIVFVMKRDRGELAESVDEPVPDLPRRGAARADAPPIQPVMNARQSEPATAAGFAVQAPGFVESVMTRGLIDQAVMLEAQDDQDSSEKACGLWEKALKIGGLSARDEALCHYYLGAYYQAREDLERSIHHHESIAIADPGLTFLSEPDESIKTLARDDFYKSLSAAYQFYARNVIKERDGLNTAISYMENKTAILKGSAAPSLLTELGCYHGLAGDHAKASETFKRASEAPDYGSEFQKRAKASALASLEEGLEEKKAELPLGSDSEEKPIIQFGPEPKAKKPAAFKWGLGGGIAGAMVIVLVVLLLPSAYKEYYKKAQESYNRGDFTGALTLVNLAKEKKATADVFNLETEIRHRLKELELRAEQARRQNEYNDLYRKALAALDRGNLAEAENFARLASERISTRELTDLRGRIQRTRAEREAAERSRRLAEADDAAFQLARRLDTQASFEEYLRSYPNGQNRQKAQDRLYGLRLIAQRAQSQKQASPVPVPPAPQESTTTSSYVQPSTGKHQEMRHFSLNGLAGARQEFTFDVVAAGQIRIEVRWVGAPRRLSLILNGPGRGGYYQRNDYGSPLIVVQNVTRAILSRGTRWKASVVSFNRTNPVSGTIIITYPK